MNKTKAFNVLLAGLALIVGVGCNIRMVDKSSGSAPAEDPAEPAEITAVSTGEWNHYVLRIPSHLVQGPVTRSLIGSKALAKPKVFRAASGSYYDDEVLGGSVYEYSFYGSDDSKEPQKVQVAVPRDLVVDHDLDLDGDLGRDFLATPRFGQLLFKNVTVKTGGHDLNLIADQIVFDQTTVKSFDLGQTAKIGDGRGGGTIKIRATRISGFVNLELRGENGGIGAPGAAPDKKLKGAQGMGGQAPAGYPGGDLMATYRNPYMQAPSCAGGRAGEQGAMGQKGYQGGLGGRGGDSGEVLIFAGERASLQIAPFLEAGIGGPGGRGGDGGEGGDGGGGGPCAAGGQQGPRGPQGDEGSVGFSGRIGKTCFVDAGRAPTCL